MFDRAAYEYALDPSLIAQVPTTERDAARLFCVERSTRTLSHLEFRDVTQLFRSGDALVLNESPVAPARFDLSDPVSGRDFEALFLHHSGAEAELLIRGGGKIKEGRRLSVADLGVDLSVLGRGEAGSVRVELRTPGWTWSEVLDRAGRMPLPPYIERGKGDARSRLDRERYQTVYAERGSIARSIAAPTAGLHFTPALLSAVEAMGVSIHRLKLHVGIGTFRPLETEDIRQHRMHSERVELAPEIVQLIRARLEGNPRRVVAVGTTVVRALESAALRILNNEACDSYETGIFITPGFSFRCVDAMITNFHQPRSPLLVLMAAFLGSPQWLREIYAEAVQHRYRFLSYGDAMWIGD